MQACLKVATCHLFAIIAPFGMHQATIAASQPRLVFRLSGIRSRHYVRPPTRTQLARAVPSARASVPVEFTRHTRMAGSPTPTPPTG